MARLDRVAAVKRIAQVGAVIGREFGYELLAEIEMMSEAALVDVPRAPRCLRAGFVSRRDPRVGVYVQACPRAGHRLRLAAEEPADDDPRQDRAGARKALAREPGHQTGAAGPPLHGRGSVRGRHPLLEAGRRTGHAALCASRGDNASQQRHDVDREVAPGASTRSHGVGAAHGPGPCRRRTARLGARAKSAAFSNLHGRWPNRWITVRPISRSSTRCGCIICAWISLPCRSRRPRSCSPPGPPRAMTAWNVWAIGRQ